MRYWRKEVWYSNRMDCVKRNPTGAWNTQWSFITRGDLMVTGRPCTRKAIMRGLRKCVKRDETTGELAEVLEILPLNDELLYLPLSSLFWLSFPLCCVNTLLFPPPRLRHDSLDTSNWGYFMSALFLIGRWLRTNRNFEFALFPFRLLKNNLR